jgi:hypothetical protein
LVEEATVVVRTVALSTPPKLLIPLHHVRKSYQPPQHQLPRMVNVQPFAIPKAVAQSNSHRAKCQIRMSPTRALVPKTALTRNKKEPRRSGALFCERLNAEWG